MRPVVFSQSLTNCLFTPLTAKNSFRYPPFLAMIRKWYLFVKQNNRKFGKPSFKIYRFTAVLIFGDKVPDLKELTAFFLTCLYLGCRLRAIYCIRSSRLL